MNRLLAQEIKHCQGYGGERTRSFSNSRVKKRQKYHCLSCKLCKKLSLVKVAQRHPRSLLNCTLRWIFSFEDAAQFHALQVAKFLRYLVLFFLFLLKTELVLQSQSRSAWKFRDSKCQSALAKLSKLRRVKYNQRDLAKALRIFCRPSVLIELPPSGAKACGRGVKLTWKNFFQPLRASIDPASEIHRTSLASDIDRTRCL